MPLPGAWFEAFKIIYTVLNRKSFVTPNSFVHISVTGGYSYNNSDDFLKQQPFSHQTETKPTMSDSREIDK